MNEFLQRVLATREKAERLRGAKDWSGASAAYTELAKAWIAAAGMAKSEGQRVERLAESEKAAAMAAECRGRLGGRAKARNERPQQDQEKKGKEAMGWGRRKNDSEPTFSSEAGAAPESDRVGPQAIEWPKDSLHAQLEGDEVGEGIIAQIHGSLKTSDVTWDDIGGQEALVEDLKTILAQAVMTRPDGSRPEGAGQILMVGPPGTGKTMLVSAMANSISKAGAFFCPKLADIKGHYVGMTEKAISLLFETARAMSPSMVFIDEVDCLCKSREGGGGGSGELGVLLAEMDGIHSKGVGKGEYPFVLSAAATNAPWALDPALMSRFSGHIVLVGAADAVGRKQILAKLMRRYESEKEVTTWLADDARTAGFSGRDLAALVKNAVAAMQKEMNPGIGKWTDIGEVQGQVQKERALSREDFEQALQVVKPSITPAIMADYEKWIGNHFHRPRGG